MSPLRLQQGVDLVPEQASEYAGAVDDLILYQFLLGTFFSVLVFGLLFFFAIRYRRRRADEWPGKQKEDMRLEIIWSTVPTVLVFVMFFWGAALFVDSRRPPADAMEVFAVGRQWMWKVQHPEGAREINELHVPLGRPVKVTLASEDVIHDFFVPAFRVKMDAVPGRYTQLWFTPNKVGKYHLFCAEYCGTDHSEMIGWVYVMEPTDYEDWLAGESGQSMASSGEGLFQKLACHTCHLADGTGRGPAHEGIFGKPVRLADGRTLGRDEAYLRESILDPGAKIVAGYSNIMPTYAGQLGEQEVLELIAYIRSKTQAPEEGGAAED